MIYRVYRVDCNGVAVAPIDECETAASFCDAVNRYMDYYGGNRYFSDNVDAENYRAAREYAAQMGE